MPKTVDFKAVTLENERPIKIQVAFNGSAVLQLAQENGVENGNQLARASGIAGPNYYENMNGDTFPALGTILKLLTGAGLKLEEIKNIRLGEILTFEEEV